MQNIKKLLSREMLINYVFGFYLISIILDLHPLYNRISTLIRVVIISLLFVIIFFTSANKKEKKLLTSYFLLYFIYVLLHLWNAKLFNVSHVLNYNYLQEILYFIKMIMNVFFIYIVYKLEFDKKKFVNLIYLSAFIISFIIVISNLFKIGYTSYDFTKPEYSLLAWFQKGNVPYLTASTKGYFHLTYQISAILVLFLPILISYLKDKITIYKMVTVILVIISLFMLGTRVSSYSPFIILGISLISYLITGFIYHNIKKSYVIVLGVLSLGSICLYLNSPLISRNLYYQELFKTKEEGKKEDDFWKLNNIPVSKMSLEEFRKYLGYFNINSEFYNNYYKLELDREFYENYISLNTTKINDTRFLEKEIIARVKYLNDNAVDTFFGIGYDRVMNIFNIESDYIMQYYAIGIIGLIIILGVNIFLFIYLCFKVLFNLKRYFTYENILLLFSIFFFLVSAYFTGNILNAISNIIPISMVIGYALSSLKSKDLNNPNEYYLGFKTTTKNKEEVLEGIFKEKKQTVIYNMNPLIIMNFLHNDKVRNEINKSEYNIPDGSGIVLASRLSSNHIENTIPGVELFEDICKRSIKHDYTIYLYGSKEESVLETKKILEKKYPKIKIVGYKNGYNKNKQEDILEITKKKPDILFVALGSPLQEEFIIKNKEALKNIKIIMPVGGSFDALSGNIKRAPKIFQKLKLEWLYRMVNEPKRFKQLFSLVKFGILVLLLNFWYNEKGLDKENYEKYNLQY